MPTPEEEIRADLADLGEHPPLQPERPYWTVQNQARLSDLEHKLRDVMRHRNGRQKNAGHIRRKD